MKNVLLVVLGGGIGSGLRYIISSYLNNINTTIPYGTLAVNVVGSFIIGVLLGVILQNNSNNNTLLLLLVTGFCGGFTTFSAFAFENFELLKSGAITSFLLYAIGSFMLGILAVASGIFIAKQLPF